MYSKQENFIKFGYFMSNEDWLTNQADEKIRARQATQKDERRRMKFLGFSITNTIRTFPIHVNRENTQLRIQVTMFVMKTSSDSSNLVKSSSKK